jgi:hypothetical protein
MVIEKGEAFIVIQNYLASGHSPRVATKNYL